MTKTEYREYLCSDHWKSTRKEAIDCAEGKCERCDLPRWLAELVYDQDVHVHHKSYANLGDEQPGDLEVLCRRCHEVESNGHSSLPKIKSHTCILCKDQHWDRRSSYCSTCSQFVNSPVVYHLCGASHPGSGNPMWKSIAYDLALWFVYQDDECAELIEYIRVMAFNHKQSMAEDIF